MDNIVESSKILAEYLGYKYIPYTQKDLKAGWYKPGFQKGAYTRIDNKFYTYLCRNHHQLRFYNSYDWLFEVIEKLEKEHIEKIERRGNVWLSYLQDPESTPKVFDDTKEGLFTCLSRTIKYLNKIKDGI